MDQLQYYEKRLPEAEFNALEQTAQLIGEVPPITIDDHKIIKLNLNKKKIADLRPVRHFKHLEELNL
ncbi:MAG: hypothetical protein GWO20_12755, partial [Candidatus Korarchaeota archaeon]|nr:hypothetical protein [Candidatus Korarchaeota archaeon]NIU84032.1 hypothetical protein [Candidatus Thorarchaeota archaeon]NIW52275.1 hypothetical protein [Candidatus Korarchaeota archaeon]